MCVHTQWSRVKGETDRRVIGGLALVDVVVGMQLLVLAAITSQQLRSSIRNHFIDIHVRLGATPSLPNDQWEVLIQLPSNDLPENWKTHHDKECRHPGKTPTYTHAPTIHIIS